MVAVSGGERVAETTDGPLTGSAGLSGQASPAPPTLIGSLGPASQPSIHPDAWIAPGAVVVGSVTIGADSSVWYGSILRADDDEILIGEQCNIQDQCCLHVDSGEQVTLERRVSLGHNATVHGCHVEEGALVGMGAVVLGRARVGAGSLIAAGAVVLPGTQIPPGVLFAGVPGRVVRELKPADQERIERTWQGYVGRARRHREAQWRP